MDAALEYISQQLTDVSEGNPDHVVNSDYLKSLVARACRDAKTCFEPLDVLRAVYKQRDFSTHSSKCVSQAIVRFLRADAEVTKHSSNRLTKSLDATCGGPVGSVVLAEGGEVPLGKEETKGDDGSTTTKWTTTIQQTATQRTVPEPVVAKVWTWIKATRELRKVTTPDKALDVISFLCRVKGCSLVWDADALEKELEPVLASALANVHAQHRRRQPQLEGKVGMEVQKKVEYWREANDFASFAFTSDLAADAFLPTACVVVASAGFEGVSKSTVAVLLADEINRRNKRLTQRVAKVSSNIPTRLHPHMIQTSFGAGEIRIKVPLPTGRSASTGSVAGDLATELRVRCGTSIEAFKARLQGAVGAVYQRLNSNSMAPQILLSLNMKICSKTKSHGVHESRVVGTFIGKGGRELNTLEASLQAVVRKHLTPTDVEASNITLHVNEGVVTVTLALAQGAKTSGLKASDKECLMLKKLFASALTTAVRDANSKADGTFVVRPVRRFRSSRGKFSASHTSHLEAFSFDYVAGKKYARASRYAEGKKNARAHKNHKKIQGLRVKSTTGHKFSGVIHDLDEQPRSAHSKADDRKARRKHRADLKREGKEAREAKKNNSAKRSAAKARLNVRRIKHYDHSADFAADQRMGLKGGW